MKTDKLIFFDYVFSFDDEIGSFIISNKSLLKNQTDKSSDLGLKVSSWLTDEFIKFLSECCQSASNNPSCRTWTYEKAGLDIHVEFDFLKECFSLTSRTLKKMNKSVLLSQKQLSNFLIEFSEFSSEIKEKREIMKEDQNFAMLESNRIFGRLTSLVIGSIGMVCLKAGGGATEKACIEEIERITTKIKANELLTYCLKYELLIKKNNLYFYNFT